MAQSFPLHAHFVFGVRNSAGLVISTLSAILAVIATLGSTSDCLAQPPKGAQATRPGHAIVSSFERFHVAEDSDLTRGGQLLVGELNCVACHAVEGPLANVVAAKKAPILDNVGKRVRPEFLREFLLNPQTAKPGTTMPHMLTNGSDAEREAQADALVHFLSLTGALVEGAAAPQAAKRGEQLFHQIGCVACHDRQTADAQPLPDSVPLGTLSKKYSLPSLQQFLAEPLAVRPSGRMPHLNLTSDESRDIAAFLLRDLPMSANLRYTYYEGRWEKLPDFATLTPKSTGTSTGFALLHGRGDDFALRFEGYVQIPRDGSYLFRIGSDDGSRLLIDGREVAKVDGIHPLQFGEGRIDLKAGARKLTVEFFEQGGGEELQAEIEGPGLSRQPLESLVTIDATPPATARLRQFVADPVKAEEGRNLFQKLNCVACHALGKQPETAATAPRLAALNADRGCLGGLPDPLGTATPRFALSTRQTAALRAAVRAVSMGGGAPANAAQDAIDRTLTTFNCYSCHQRGGKGGVAETRNASFITNQPEMGDEGRIPPHLTGVGAKLTAEWLGHVFNNGAKDRPYMFTRMPKFGTANVGHLVAALAAADPEPAYRRPAVAVTPGALKATGRKLVGAQGFSCIKCHTWGNIPATGIQSIGMTTMARRLREPWCHAYILDPPAFRPGTRMPSAWPMGQTLLPGVLNGDTQQQIHSVWSFLADGDKAAVPLGLGRDPIELIADSEPVMYRNFIEGAGPRAIGVGYPQKLNLAFDANDLRLALVWQGAFIDATRHWTDRGVGFQAPLGDNVLKLPGGVSFAALETPDASWPGQPARDQGAKFRGYRLNAAREPVFSYEIAGLKIEDHPRPIAATASEGGRFVRTLVATRLEPPAGGSRIWFRAAVGGKIEPIAGGGFLVDGQWRVKVAVAGESPIVRARGNQSELLIPVPAAGPPATIVQEFQW
ncbi:MAG: c-type cytochrome [Planctomycetota bacterium]